MQAASTQHRIHSASEVRLQSAAAPSEDDSDNILMQCYCEGDFRAFEILYRRHSRGLYRYIAWQATYKDWADEIAQDTWLRLHDARPNYRPQAGFKTFLYAIARNRMIDLIRQHRVVLESDLGSADDDHSVFEHMVDHHALQQANPGVDQQTDALHDAIKSLPKEQREALIAQQFSGLSLQEIAELTDTSVETVKSRLRYAMKKLKQILLVESGVMAA